MKISLRAVGVSALILASAVATTSYGQSAAEDPQAAALKLIRMSRTLHDRAIETSDPVLMLSAARLRKDSGMKAGALGTLENSGEDAGDISGETFSWERWLEEAVRLSGGSDVIAGLATDIRTSGSKGLAGQAVYTEGRLAAHSSHRYSDLNFVGGEFAEVYSEGLGKADIDLFVRDSRGAIVCSQTDSSNINQCGWTPGATGPFEVTLENKSDFADTYALTTN
ncbi:hypothetical protein [Oricola sp.]|uniref:hypothetical protein n=1 Tax=Oricola sp. TaxID=1979950 RepID=UPI000C8D5526|nr:hypothetical protein [Ahrensia sp.]MCK5749630.1 hypothetical protein [Oricola sp.]|tara:strand:+ start:27816 stop:28487 length:672 start_codon:yes stop_codon:yes gene_type:complete